MILIKYGDTLAGVVIWVTNFVVVNLELGGSLRIHL